MKRKNRVTKGGKTGRPAVRSDGQAMSDTERQARRRKRVGKTMNRQARARYRLAKQGNAAELRREAWQNAQPLLEGMELRVGNVLEGALDDVPNEEAALIIADPPYGNRAGPLLEWLATFSWRKLGDGAALFLFTGQARLYRDMSIFYPYFGEPFWLCAELHTSSQRLMGKLIYPGWKPVLVYVKGGQRRPDLRAFISDVLRPRRDKSVHPWAQGDGGIAPLIENLTKPGELFIDPFCGTGAFVRIAASKGLRAIGVDFVEGGAPVIAAGNVNNLSRRVAG